MRSFRSLFRVGIACLAMWASLAGSAQAQYIPEWDTTRPPSDPTRTVEYKSASTETWIRLTPYFAMVKFADDLDLEGGWGKAAAGGGGLMLEVDAGDTVMVSFDLGLYAAVQRKVLGADNDLNGDCAHAGVYVALKSPELKLGVLQIMPGFGLGAFWLGNYDDEEVFAGGVPDTSFPPFEDTILFRFTVGLRLDLDVSDHFQLGVWGRAHLPFYAMGDAVGLMELETFDLSPSYMTPELLVYLSFTF